MQQRQDMFLQGRLMVDQQVAATDQVHTRERRVGGDVLSSENTHFADRLADAVAAIRLREETAQTLRRDLRRDVLRVETGAGLFETLLVGVSGENLDWNVAVAFTGEFREGHD